MSALKGLSVVDLTRVRAGPFCVRQLSDWGADVIRVELPKSIEPVDTLSGLPSDFENLQRNKRSLTLNLKEEEARAILMKLVAKADVVVENFRPDVKHRLKVDYETLSKANPRLVYGSVSGFGQDGPYALRAGFDQIAQGLGGLMSITGEPGRGPMRVGIAVADVGAGLYCAFGILLALYERERSGRGQWVHTSLLEAQIALLDFMAARWLIDKVVPGQAGNDHPTTAPTGVYETSDGVINIGIGGEPMWKGFCKTLGAPELADDPRFTTSVERVQNRAAMTEEINKRLRKRTTAEWIETLNAAGMPSGPIHTIDKVFEDPQVKHLGIAKQVAHPARGTIEVVGQPVHLSRTPSAIQRSAPQKGEHTREILRDLGYSDERIDDLQRRKIV